MDDDENDIFFVQRAFADIEVHCSFQVLNHGGQVVQYLSREGEYADGIKYPLPMLMLIDLKMPVMDGFQVLQWLRSRPGIKVIPTIVFSSSDQQEDITRAYELGANSFITKSATRNGILAKFQTLSHYWLEHCKYPVISDIAGGSSSAVA